MGTRRRPCTFRVIGEFQPQPELFPQGLTHGYVYLIPKNPSAVDVFGDNYMCLPIIQDEKGNYMLVTDSATRGMRSAKVKSVERIAKELGDLFTQKPQMREINLKRSCVLGTTKKETSLKRRNSGPGHTWRNEIAKSTRISMHQSS